jgi:hypothetical protein
MASMKWSCAGVLALVACAVLMFAQGASAAFGGGCDSDYRHSGYGTSVLACVSSSGPKTAVPDAYVYVTPGLDRDCTVTISMYHNMWGLVSQRVHPCLYSSGVMRYPGYDRIDIDRGAVHVLATVSHYYAGAWRNASSWTPWLYMP